MVSICLSDIFIALFLLIFNQPGLTPGRYITLVNSSAQACKVLTIFATFLFAAPWYNFLGEAKFLSTSFSFFA